MDEADYYDPCKRGLHVCGINATETEFKTILNLPLASKAQARALFDQAFAELACEEPFDMVVDLVEDFDIEEDFPIRRQSLDRLKSMHAALVDAESP